MLVVLWWWCAALTLSAADSDLAKDPATRQLLDFKTNTTGPIGVLTSDAGKPIDLRETQNVNSDVLTNQFFLDNLLHGVDERIPERVVHAKGTGALGYFEVTHDVSKYTKAKIFNGLGKKTRMVGRLSVGLQNKGGTDTPRLDLRGFSMKFYTEEGVLDFLNIQVPVYIYDDSGLFGPIVHAFKRNPKTNLFDYSQTIDFITYHPEAVHSLLWLASEYGLVRGYRKMNAFPIHTYRLYNEKGDTFFVRFKFLSEQGVDSFSLSEATLLSGMDPDFCTRDLYNAIANKNYPSWTLKMDVLARPLDELDFDPFDVTKLWKNGTYFTETIGRLTLDKNVDNQFAEVELAAYNPGNLVPGISNPPDELFRGRIIAYLNTQTYRLGTNKNKIEVNRPNYAKTYNRDGKPPVLDNMRNTPNYFPNSFQGPQSYIDVGKPKDFLYSEETRAIDLEPSRRFYREVLVTEKQKNFLIENLGTILARVLSLPKENFLKLLSRVDEELAKRVRLAAEVAAAQAAANRVVVDRNEL